MAMLNFTLLQSALICGITWFTWKFFRQFVVKSDLDNVPGLPSPSFLYGTCLNGRRLHQVLICPSSRPRSTTPR